jgi:hypothetical protein
LDGQINSGGDDLFLSKFSVSPQITFAEGSSTTTLAVDPVVDSLAEGAETLAVTVLAGAGYTVGTDAVATGTIDDARSDTLHGIAYSWKTHMLLKDVALKAAGGGQSDDGGNAPIQFKGISWDASGRTTLEVWSHSATAFENVGFELELTNATGITFTPGSLPANAAGVSGWTVLANVEGSRLSVASFASLSSYAISAGDFKLGTLTCEGGAGPAIDLLFLGGEVGSTAASPYELSGAGASTNANGEFNFGPLQAGNYNLAATRDTADIGNAITSADALAALKLAVGLNPNADPDGASGPKTAPAVSPYQFMAADVIGTDGRITSADALAILKMAVRLPTAPAKEWVFVEETRDFWDEASGSFTLNRNAAVSNQNIGATAPGEVNLVGTLKGDVNGSWTAPEGSIDLDTLAPTHFTALSTVYGMPLTQFGIY